MPIPTETLYCSEQICIPPTFPYLLRQFAKAAIRTQPTDLLRWSTAYFRCLSLNIPPPVKPRLEYPIPRSYCGITPGWLKALLYQLQNNQTIPFKVLWDRWVGACLEHKTLIEILCLGGFTDAQAIPWLKFISLCAAFLTDDLTHTMILICEILTEEPEGGSGMITIETFIDVYTFLAGIDASKPQTMKNMYFLDSELNLWREKAEKLEKAEVQEESVVEEESSTTSSVTVSQHVDRKEEIEEIVSCPSLHTEESKEFIIEEEEKIDSRKSTDTVDNDKLQQLLEQAKETSVTIHFEDQEDMGEGEEDYEAEVQSKVSSEEIEEIVPAKEPSEGSVKEEKPDEKSIVPESAVDPLLSQETVSDRAVQEIGEESAASDEDKHLQEDLEKLKILQQELLGETDDELEKYKCRLIEDMPLDKSQESAIGHFQEPILSVHDTEEDKEKPTEEEKTDKSEVSVEEDAESHQYEDVYVNAVPGIGPIVSEEIIEAVCKYMKEMAAIQSGMVMPRNITHFNCPPLETIEN